MKTTAPAAAKSRTDSAVVRGLNLLLADSYALMANSHHAHWNVEGPNFFALHEAFEHHYKNLFEAVDEIAERTRALEALSIGGLQALAKEAGLEEFSGPVSDKDFVAALIVAHEKTVEDAKSLRDAAEEAGDLETQDLAIDRIKWHQKTIWMLKSFLK